MGAACFARRWFGVRQGQVPSVTGRIMFGLRKLDLALPGRTCQLVDANRHGFSLDCRANDFTLDAPDPRVRGVRWSNARSATNWGESGCHWPPTRATMSAPRLRTQARPKPGRRDSPSFL